MDGPPRSAPTAAVPIPGMFDEEEDEAVDEGRAIGDSAAKADDEDDNDVLCCLLVVAVAA